jgi:adenine-specific DNA methylase
MHYDTLITEAFAEARRVVSTDGVVTIVFGHGEPEVWQRLLTAIDAAGLVLTGVGRPRPSKAARSGSPTS